MAIFQPSSDTQRISKHRDPIFCKVQLGKTSVCIANLRDNLFYITLAEKVQSQPFRKGLFCVLTFPVEKVVWDVWQYRLWSFQTGIQN